jgi:hypothetical protein
MLLLQQCWKAADQMQAIERLRLEKHSAAAVAGCGPRAPATALPTHTQECDLCVIF